MTNLIYSQMKPNEQKNSVSSNRLCFFGFHSWVFVILIEFFFFLGFTNFLESHGIYSFIISATFRNEF